ncbi:MAG TPA: hypothetical protein PLD25_26710 [Chloroflexota bacterium]|nr:hypothetical protein [Chloroflexota bacterium]HUM67506.1 hypothetical protein [Chloroflexota bacterium]
MRVHKITQLARQWVSAEEAQTPGFIGAHLQGSLNGLSAEADFPAHRDVDIKIVLADGGRGNRAVWYEGLMLDVAFGTPGEYEVTAVLSNPRLAPHLAHGHILADPTGLLGKVQRAVVGEYGRRRWVEARCQWEKELVQTTLDQPDFTVLALSFTLMYLGGLLAVASLNIPTHRRSLIGMKSILQAQKRLELHTNALQILGCVRMTRSQVEGYLPFVAQAFPQAVAIYRTPIPYVGYKLRPHLLPYYTAAAQEMIDEGHHREAMQWILHTYFLLNLVFQNDATAVERKCFSSLYQQLLADLGLATTMQLTARREALRHLLPHFFVLVAEMVDEKQ